MAFFSPSPTAYIMEAGVSRPAVVSALGEWDDLIAAIEANTGANLEGTLRTLSLGALDTTTGWYAQSYATSTVDAFIQPQGKNAVYNGVGLLGKYALTGFFGPDINIYEGDQYVDYANRYYDINLIEPREIGNYLHHQETELLKRTMHADRPATYGTGATVTDPRYRTKVWMDTYLEHPYHLDAYLTKDDGTTAASYLVQFSNAPYPISRVFYGGIDKDVVFAIRPPDTKPILDWSMGAVGYIEEVQIEIYTMDKAGITGENLHWKAQYMLRLLQETYAIGSGATRTYTDIKPKTERHGGVTLYSSVFTLRYKRGVT